MAKRALQQKAISLRKSGKRYSEIKKIVPVRKGSLSLWLKNYPLSKSQIARLEEKKSRQIERYIQSMRLKRNNKLRGYYEIQRKKHLPFTKEELYLAGLFLYWGEGNKSSRHTISINNTDPRVIKFALYWIIKGLGIDKSKIKVLVHLYSDMEVEKELNFWSEGIGIDRNQFSRPYIKESKKTGLSQRGFGHGTCTLITHNTVVKENLFMSLEAISDYYNRKLSKI